MIESVITKAKFAKLAQVSAAAISKALRGPLASALIKNKWIDLNSDAAQAYLKKRNIEVPRIADSQNDLPTTRPAPPAPPPPTTRPRRAPPPLPPSPAEQINISELEREVSRLVGKFGHTVQIKEWIQCGKASADMDAKRIVNAEKRGLLIPRAFVEQHIISNFEKVHNQLLTDGARTLSGKIVDAFKAGETIESCEAIASEAISKYILTAKDSVKNAMRQLKK